MHQETLEMIQPQLTSLDKYLVLKHATQVHSFEKNSSESKKNLLALDKIRDMICMAEDKIKSITEDMFVNAESKCVHLNEPSYFDDDFDQKSYIQQLVKAKLYGMTIIQDVDTTNMLRKNKMMMKTMVNMKNRSTLQSSSRRLSLETFEPVREIETSTATNRSIVKNIQLIELKADYDDDDDEPEQKCKSYKLAVQNLPSISIRSQLMEQKFPSVDIYPCDENNSVPDKNYNIAVVESKHKEDVIIKEVPVQNVTDTNVGVELNSTCKDEDKPSILPSKKVKFVKLVDDPALMKLDFPVINTGSDLKNNVNLGLSEIANQSNSFVFLNKHNINLPVSDSPYRSLRKKNISTLKKFGLPEIQKIYNPKKTLLIQRGSSFQFSSPFITTNKSHKTFTSRQYGSKNSYSSSKPLNVTSTKKSHVSTEYIPYSKFTVGGVKVDRKPLSHSHSITIDDPRAVNIPMTYNDIDESYDINDLNINSTNSMNQTEEIDPNSHVEPESTNSKDILSNVSKVNSEHNKATQTSLKYIGDICKDIRNVNEDVVENLETIKANGAIVENNLQIEDEPVPSTSKLPNENENIIEMTDSPKAIKKGKVSTLPKDTQTPHLKTVDVMTSPPKMINRKLSPAFVETKKSTLTSPVNFSGDDQISNKEMKVNESLLLSSNDSKHDPNDSGSKSKYYKKQQSKIDISTDDYIEGSYSESSDLQSLGEINLRILKKRLVKIMDDTNSVYSNSSFTTSINSDIHWNSTLSSKKSDGEISVQVNNRRK
ncbi:uncharacterized protein LOC143913205 [Arctopsyche grandis]|uniref:uncharacterized protein LOC143913205 n=1 Tax=Arctopsyche grandis TaxID=121162 RepID=UPI00406DA0E1